MKKTIAVILAIAIMLTATSCSVFRKNIRTMATYKDPETMGGYWNITTQTGQEFNHVKCTYWGTEDDTACFVMDDGTLVFQSGAVTCVRVK